MFFPLNNLKYASTAAAPGWPRLKGGRHTHAQKQSSSASFPRRKARSWCSKKRYKYHLKTRLAQAGISHQPWQQEASDRDSWRSSVRKASRNFEAERHEAVQERQRRQKERAASQSFSAETFACPKCSRVCASRSGLCCHQRACKNWPSTFKKNPRLRGTSHHHHHQREQKDEGQRA